MAKQRHSWPLEKAMETAKHFTSRSELFRQYPGCYMALKKAKRLDDLLPKIPRKRKWSLSAIKKLCEENELRSKKELNIQAPSALRTAYRNGWIEVLFPSDHGQ